MAEVEPTGRRRTPDLLTLVVGLGCVAIAAAALVGIPLSLPDVEVRWLLAGIAVGLGVLLLAASLPGRRTRRD